jgi:aspartate ammonia-lyase
MIQNAVASLIKLKDALLKKSKEFESVIKMGRTQLQDAVPVSFGQSFRAYASAISRDISRFEKAVEALSSLNMGGTAIGTGLNASPYYIENILPKLAEVTNLALTQAEDLIDATQNADCFVFVSGIVKACATTLSKMASDLRLMSSGPRTGFAELNLPPKQNGSSIMPGKVNPVIPEVVNQIAFRIVGNDVTVTLAAEAGQLELNALEPILFYSLFESLKILRSGVDTLRKECIEGLTVNTEACEDEVERSIGTVTALCPKLGYARAAAIAKRALNEKRNIRDVLKEEGVLDSEGIDELLDPHTMI